MADPNRFWLTGTL